MVVLLSGTIVGSYSVSSRVSTGMGISPSCLSQLSLAIPPWLGVMSTGSGYSLRWRRNGKLLGLVTRNISTLTQSVEHWLAVEPSIRPPVVIC